jgi:hypothetical protein
MNRNISIIKSTGKPASNLHGSCAVLALSNILGMSYEQATAWTIKNRLAAKVVNSNGLDHVSGTTYRKNPSSFQTYKQLRPNAKVTRYLGQHHYNHFVKNAGKDGVQTLEESLKQSHADAIEKRTKISTFINQNPTGRHLILTRDHALALINGVLYNNNNEGGHYTNQYLNYTVKF